MNSETVEFCKKEIHDLLNKKLIRKSKSPWSCAAFYVKKNAEIERGTPCLVINYKPLNKVLEWIRYPIPNKNDLVHRLSDAIVFSKLYMKFGFWQVQISETDKYKTTFTIPFRHYEWNVMPFGLKNAPSEFQNISSIPLVISPLFILMMSLFIPNSLMNIGNICIHFLISSNVMVLLSLLRKSNYFKQRFISLAMTFLKDKFVPLTKPFNLLTNSLLSLLIKHSYKDSLGLWTTLLSFIRIWGNNVNHSLIGYRIILLLGLIFILLLLKKSSLMLKLFLVLVFLLLMPLKLLKLMPLTLVMKEFWNNLFPQTHLNK